MEHMSTRLDLPIAIRKVDRFEKGFQSPLLQVDQRQFQEILEYSSRNFNHQYTL